MNVITKPVLRAARKLVEKPENWTQCVGAETSEGMAVVCTDPKATCFCINGAVARVLGFIDWRKAADVLKSEGMVAYADEIHVFNDADERTHTEILAYFDDLIERAPEAQ